MPPPSGRRSAGIRERLAQGLRERVEVVARTSILQARQRGVNVRLGDGTRFGLEDLRMRGRPVALVGMEERLVQLLARAQAGVDDRDVAPRLLAGQPDHLLRQQTDRYRVAHVERVHRLVGADRRCLQDQLAGFGDGHEVARHLGVGHRHRAALADLFAEQRHHAAGRVQHVAEAHRHVARHAVLGLGLADHLANRLVAPSTLTGSTALSVEISTNVPIAAS